MARIFDTFEEVDSLIRKELGKNEDNWLKILKLCEWIFTWKGSVVKAKLRDEQMRKLVFFRSNWNFFCINSVDSNELPSFEFWCKKRNPPQIMGCIDRRTYWYRLNGSDVKAMELEKLKELVIGSFNDKYGL